VIGSVIFSANRRYVRCNTGCLNGGDTWGREVAEKNLTPLPYGIFKGYDNTSQTLQKDVSHIYHTYCITYPGDNRDGGLHLIIMEEQFPVLYLLWADDTNRWPPRPRNATAWSPDGFTSNMTTDILTIDPGGGKGTYITPELSRLGDWQVRSTKYYCTVR